MVRTALDLQNEIQEGLDGITRLLTARLSAGDRKLAEAFKKLCTNPNSGLDAILNRQSKPPAVIGNGDTTYIKTTGPTTIAYTTRPGSWVEYPVNRILADGEEFGEGTARIEGEGELTITYDLQNGVYLLTIGQLIEHIRQSYSYETEVRTISGGSTQTTKINVWPRVFDYYFNHGTFDFDDPAARPLVQKIAALGAREPVTLEEEEIKIALKAADLARRTYTNFGETYNGIVALRSVNPHIAAQPEQVTVNGEEIKLTFTTRHGRRESTTTMNTKGPVFLNIRASSMYFLPARIAAEYAEMMLQDGQVFRSDGVCVTAGNPGTGIKISDLEACITGTGNDSTEQIKPPSHTCEYASGIMSLVAGLCAAALIYFDKNSNGSIRDFLCSAVIGLITMGVTASLTYLPLVMSGGDSEVRGIEYRRKLEQAAGINRQKMHVLLRGQEYVRE